MNREYFVKSTVPAVFGDNMMFNTFVTIKGGCKDAKQIYETLVSFCVSDIKKSTGRDVEPGQVSVKIMSWLQ